MLTRAVFPGLRAVKQTSFPGPGWVPTVVMVAVVRRRLGFFVSLLLTAVLALAGCGDDPTDAVDDDPTGQATPSAEPTQPDEPPPSSVSSAAVPPAAGELLELSNVSVRVPQGFQPDPPDLSYLRFAFERGGIQSIALGNTPAVNEALSLREQARISIRNNVYSRPPTMLDPVEIAGLTLYHYAGPISANEYVEEYGAIHDGSQVSVNFRLATTTPEAEREELVASVMASLTFS